MENTYSYLWYSSLYLRSLQFVWRASISGSDNLKLQHMNIVKDRQLKSVNDLKETEKKITFLNIFQISNKIICSNKIITALRISRMFYDWRFFHRINLEKSGSIGQFLRVFLFIAPPSA